MSIKGSSKKIKTEMLLPVFAVFAAVAAVIRMYQSFTMIDPETGFFKSENFSITMLYIILAVGSVLLFAIAYLSEKVPVSNLPKGKSIGLGVTSALLGAALIYDAFVQIHGFIALCSGVDLAAFGGSGSLALQMMKSGVGPRGVEGIFAAFSALYFIIFSLSFFGAKINVSSRKVLAVMPVFWATARMIQRFTRTISFIFVSDLLLEIFMIAFMMLFFLYFAQLASHVNSRHVMNKVISYGLIGAVFAIVVAFPRVLLLIASPELIVEQCPLEVCDLAFAAFVIVLCAALMKMPKNDNLSLKQVESLRKQRKLEDESSEDNLAEKE